MPAELQNVVAPTVRSDLRRAVVPWAVGRAVVLVALGAVHQVRDHAAVAGVRLVTVGLSSWDASFYAAIARHGYGAVEARDGLRFFPLYPLVGRLTGGSDLAMVLLANAAMLLALGLLAQLAREWCDDRTAERVVWLAALGPGALASVMGYAEPFFLVLSIGCVLAARRGSVGLAAVCGVGAALTRPVGILLALYLVVDGWERRSPRTAVAAVGPVVGLGAFLVWAHDRTGDWLRPLRLQSKANLRGETVDPFRAVWSALHNGFHDHRSGPLLHVAWVGVAVVLLVVAVRRLPRAASALAVVSVVVALTSRNLDSVERYLFATFPLVIAAASVRVHRDVERAVLVALGAMLTVYAVLAFTTAYIP